MKKQLIIALACLAPLAFTACSKKSEDANTEQSAVASDDQPTSPEQQAKIDALDKPVLDEKNTDVKKANAHASEVKVQ
ncbi:hypothetical protein [Acinetobacter sp. MB5]|uniref:hypothetical protein n=1 Tax=Acinetobacter sp. MB5 TaxID=2069438 RepID=UPI000DD02B16|nr:hypothetical protein [Acinetobacter sp. MB5]